jgi:hypothetical protein
MDTNLISSINQTFQIELPENISFEVLKEKLSAYINHLIQADFEKLISILYRIDVNEYKLKNMLLENNGEDASKIIADLIIERQVQKIKSRQQSSKRDNTMSDDEKW